MIVYNITISINSEREEEFIDWMKKVYIPAVLDGGYFSDHRFLRLLHNPEEGEGASFAAQFYAENMTKMMGFEKEEAKKVHEKLALRFPNEFVVFRSLLESVD